MITAEQFDMFPTLPPRTVEPSVREMWNDYRKDFDKYGGLMGTGVAAFALGVSKARLFQMIDAGILRAKPYFNNTLMVPYCDIEERLIAKRDGKVSNGRPKKS